MIEKIFALTDYTNDEFEKIKGVLDRRSEEDDRLSEDLGYFDLTKFKMMTALSDEDRARIDQSEFPERTVFVSQRFDNEFLDGMVSRGTFRQVVAQSITGSESDLIDQMLQAKRNRQQHDINVGNASREEQRRLGQEREDNLERQRRENREDYNRRIDQISKQADQEKERERKEAAEEAREEQRKADQKRRDDERAERERLRKEKEDAERQAKADAEQEEKRRQEELRRTARTVNPDEDGNTPSTGGGIGEESAEQLLRRLVYLSSQYNEDTRGGCGTVPMRIRNGAGVGQLADKLDLQIEFKEIESMKMVQMNLG